MKPLGPAGEEAGLGSGPPNWGTGLEGVSPLGWGTLGTLKPPEGCLGGPLALLLAISRRPTDLTEEPRT
jgi:hypothetical protein